MDWARLRMLPREYLHWVLGTWPILIPILVAASHAALVFVAFPANKEFISKAVGTGLQIVGGLLVLISINGALKEFDRKTLYGAIKHWWSSRPRWKRQSITINVEAGGISLSGSAALSVGRAHGGTLDDRVRQIEIQLTHLSERIEEVDRLLNNRVQALHGLVDREVQNVKESVAKVGQQVRTAAIGGYKGQVLGVLLAIYGTLVGM